MKLIITSEVEAKLHAYVRAVNTEIAGMGKARISHEGDIMLLDVAIYDQEVTGGTADLSTEALARFQTELIQKGESPKDWIVWWHSHADMSAFFSGRDTATIASSDEFQHLISLVVNRRRDRQARLDVFHPFRFTQENLEIVVGTTAFVVPEEIQAEVEEKVKIKSWPVWKGTSSKFGFHDEEEYRHGGKVLPVSNADDYGELRSGLTSPPRIIDPSDPSSLDNDDIYTIVTALKDRIQEFKNTGQEDSSECIDLRDELGDWEYELVQRGDSERVATAYKEFNGEK